MFFTPSERLSPRVAGFPDLGEPTGRAAFLVPFLPLLSLRPRAQSCGAHRNTLDPSLGTLPTFTERLLAAPQSGPRRQTILAPLPFRVSPVFCSLGPRSHFSPSANRQAWGRGFELCLLESSFVFVGSVTQASRWPSLGLSPLPVRWMFCGRCSPRFLLLVQDPVRWLSECLWSLQQDTAWAQRACTPLQQRETGVVWRTSTAEVQSQKR